MLLVTTLGGLVRLTNLTAKPPWTDEFATLVFSLGNDYQSVPLDQVMAIETLLQPLRPNLQAGVSDVISLLLHQDNHPPLYFVLVHLWLKVFPYHDLEGFLWLSRLLPVIFGTLAIPSIFFLVRSTFGSLKVANLTAMFMAFSPYAVFLSQEARHYTMAILFVIFSLACLLRSLQEVSQKKSFSTWLVFVWVGVNSLGLTVHYFFAITLVAEVLTLFLFYLREGLPIPAIKRFFAVFLGTATTGIVWVLFVIPASYGQSMTTWIQQDNSNLFSLIKPVFQLAAAWITMLYLLPIESPFVGVIIVSLLLMFLFLCWIMPRLRLGIRRGLQNYPLLYKTNISFIFCAIALFFLLTYFVGIDITRGARYSFVYFPAVIILLGVALASSGASLKDLILVSVVTFCSALTIVFNLGYQKYYRPDLLLPILESNSRPGVVKVIAIPYKSIVQIGELMGLAWVLDKEQSLLDTQFLFWDHVPLPTSLATIKSDFDLWLIDSNTPPPTIPNCRLTLDPLPSVNGYPFFIYQCHNSSVE